MDGKRGLLEADIEVMFSMVEAIANSNSSVRCEPARTILTLCNTLKKANAREIFILCSPLSPNTDRLTELMIKYREYWVFTNTQRFLIGESERVVRRMAAVGLNLSSTNIKKQA